VQVEDILDRQPNRFLERLSYLHYHLRLCDKGVDLVTNLMTNY
jgi:hypothetical protein